jgi:hypothetical protein
MRRFDMDMRSLALRLVASTATCVALVSPAADDAAQRKDLAAVIALQGQPCGEVVSVVVNGANDFIAACKDGNRYRVFVNAEGRVVVQKR